MAFWAVTVALVLMMSGHTGLASILLFLAFLTF